MVVAGLASGDDTSRVQVQIDSSWALQILSGEVSPVAILDRRLGKPGPPMAQTIRGVVSKRKLHRVDSRVANQNPAPGERLNVEEVRAGTYA